MTLYSSFTFTTFLLQRLYVDNIGTCFPLQTSKGYHHDHHLDKGGKGYKTDEYHKKQYEEAEGKKKKHHDHAGHKGSHEEEAFGHRGANFDEKKGHKKGHKTKGKFV